MTNTLNVQGRRTILYVTNKSGGSVALGDVVIGDTSNDEAFTTTTTAGLITSWVGVVIEVNGIANNASGRVCVQGYVSLVNTSASVTRGYFGKTHTVAKQAVAVSSRATGVFCEFLTGGTTPTATLFGMPDGSTGAAGSPGTPALTLGTTNGAGSAVTLVATDATIAAFDATVPVTQAMGDAAAAGAAGAAARRDHVHGMPAAVGSGRVLLTSGDLTTTSTTFTDLTGATVTLTTGARRCLVVLLCDSFHGTTAAATYFDIAVDGTRQGGSDGLQRFNQITGGSEEHGVSISYVTAALSAGSHTIKAQWRVSSGTGNVKASSVIPLHFAVVEQFS